MTADPAAAYRAGWEAGRYAGAARTDAWRLYAYVLERTVNCYRSGIMPGPRLLQQHGRALRQIAKYSRDRRS